MITWPSSLPQSLLLDGFGQALPENRLRSSVDVGPAKVRRRTSQNVYLLSGDMVMTVEQWRILQSFVRNDLGEGSLPFTFLDPLYRGERKLELDFITGKGVIAGMPLLVRFGDTLPSIRNALSTDLVRVTMDLEVLPGPTGDFEGSPLDVLTVSRPSKASYFDANGALKWADENQPRIDHDPVTGEPLGLLIEPKATNILTWSEKFDDSSWEKQGVTVTYEGDGLWKVERAPTATEGIMSRLGKMNANYNADARVLRSHYIDVKRGNARYAVLMVKRTSMGTNDRRMIVDLETLQVTSNNLDVNDTSTIVRDIGNGTIRIGFSGTTDLTSGGTRANIGITTSNSPTDSTDADVGDYIYVLRAQSEDGPVATSYIKTEGSQVTRAVDNISIPLSAFPWNEAEMSVFAEFQTFGLLGIPTTQNILSRQSDARFLYQLTSSANLAVYDGTNFLNLGAISTGQVVKAASSFGPRGLRGCVNGGSVVSTGYDGTFGTSPNLYLGSLNGSGGHYIHFRKLKLFPRQLSDDELRAVTI